jgi:hypothetical protein
MEPAKDPDTWPPGRVVTLFGGLPGRSVKHCRFTSKEGCKMPYIIVTSLYPSHKAQEVGETYIEALKKYPPDESQAAQVVPAAAKTTLQGVEVISIVEPKAGKVEEALNRARDEMAMFLPIEGFEYSIDTYGTVSEAMSSIGMNMP